MVLVCLLSAIMMFADEQDKDSVFQFGFAERFRIVSWDNPITLNGDAPEQSTFTRHRTNLSAKWTPSEYVEVFAKITNEFRYYFTPDDREFNIHEIFIDNLYLKWRRAFRMPVTLTLGRQNIMLDEGFVVMDGHPLDGSRSISFNAARADIQLGKRGNLTLFYTYQPETDNILPVINVKDQPLIEQPYEGFGAYYKTRFGKADISLYYIRKNIDPTDTIRSESGINTYGARLQLPLLKDLSITGEAAFQDGWIGYSSPQIQNQSTENRSLDYMEIAADSGSNRMDRSAFGGYFHLDYKIKRVFPLPDQITFGGIYLSGNDMNTGEYKAWDPLFSRWPKWSESFIYTQIAEGGVAYWSNITSLYAKIGFKINEEINLDIAYHHLGAAEHNQTLSMFPGGSGKTRGDLFITKLIFRLSKNLTGHLLWEGFRPGDFYFDSASGYSWFRFELLYRI